MKRKIIISTMKRNELYARRMQRMAFFKNAPPRRTSRRHVRRALWCRKKEKNVLQSHADYRVNTSNGKTLLSKSIGETRDHMQCFNVCTNISGRFEKQIQFLRNDEPQSIMLLTNSEPKLHLIPRCAFASFLRQ